MALCNTLICEDGLNASECLECTMQEEAPQHDAALPQVSPGDEAIASGEESAGLDDAANHAVMSASGSTSRSQQLTPELRQMSQKGSYKRRKLMHDASRRWFGLEVSKLEPDTACNFDGKHLLLEVVIDPQASGGQMLFMQVECKNERCKRVLRVPALTLGVNTPEEVFCEGCQKCYYFRFCTFCNHSFFNSDPYKVQRTASGDENSVIKEHRNSEGCKRWQDFRAGRHEWVGLTVPDLLHWLIPMTDTTKSILAEPGVWRVPVKGLLDALQTASELECNAQQVAYVGEQGIESVQDRLATLSRNIQPKGRGNQGDMAYWYSRHQSLTDPFPTGTIVQLVDPPSGEGRAVLVRDDVPGRGLPVVVSDDVALIKADIGRPDTVEEEATGHWVAEAGQVPIQVRGAVNVGDPIGPAGDGTGFGVVVKRGEATNIVGTAVASKPDLDGQLEVVVSIASISQQRSVEKGMRIDIRTAAGKSLALEVEPEDSVVTLKNRIHDHEVLICAPSGSRFCLMISSH